MFGAILFISVSALFGAPTATASQPPQLGFHANRGDALHLSAAKEGGASFVVLVFSWRDIEPVEGYLYWETPDAALRAADHYGLEVVARLDQPPDWARVYDSPVPFDVDAYAVFTRKVAQRYGDQVTGLIIWNEPNLALEWNGERPDPAAYSELLHAAYAASKPVAPDLPIVSAGLAFTEGDGVTAMNDLAYLEALYEHGAGDAFDILAAHPYGFGRPPEESPAIDRLNFRRLELHRAIMSQHGDGDKQVWITEMGWRTAAPDPEDRWQVVGAGEQGAYTLRALDYASERWPWLQRMSFWELNASEDSYGYAFWQGPDHPSEAYIQLAARAALETDALDQTLPASTSQERVDIVAADVIVRLGDRGELHPHWVHLRGDGEPRLRWTTEFYLTPLQAIGRYDLLLETMQIDQPTNRLFLNDQELGHLAPRTKPDPTSSWTTQRFAVPKEALQAGVNRITLRAGLRSPMRQYDWWRNENLQVRNVRLVPAEVVPALDVSSHVLPMPGIWAEVHRLRRVGDADDAALWIAANRRGQLWRLDLATDGALGAVTDEGLNADLVFLDIATYDGITVAATDRGLYVRSDEPSWLPIRGTPRTQAHMLLAHDDPAEGVRVYAGFERRGIWRIDVDTGNWQPDGLNGQSVLDLAATQDGKLFAATDRGVFQRGQDAWHPLPAPPVSASIDSGKKDNFFVTRLFGGADQVVARHDDRLWQYDKGMAWTPYGPEALQGYAFSVIDCCEPGAAWIATNHHGLWRQTAAGEWLRADGDVFTDLELTGGAAVGDTIFVAANNGLYVAGLDKRTGSAADVAWRHVTGLAPTVTDLIIAPDAATWVAATPAGIWRSRDAGRSWSAISPPWIVWDLALGPDNRLYVARSDGVAYTDGWSAEVVSWSETDGLDTVTFFDVSPHPTRPKLLWAGTWGNNIGVSENGGEGMRPLHNGLETLSVLDILWHATPDQATVGTLAGIYRTDDGGESWFKLTSQLDEQTVYALHQTQTGSILAGTSSGLWQSNDYGASWSSAIGFPVDTVLRLGSLYPDGEDLIWAGTESAGLWFSRDLGASWQHVGLDGSSVYAVQSNSDGEIIAATDRGLEQPKR